MPPNTSSTLVGGTSTSVLCFFFPYCFCESAADPAVIATDGTALPIPFDPSWNEWSLKLLTARRQHQFETNQMKMNHWMNQKHVGNNLATGENQTSLKEICILCVCVCVCQRAKLDFFINVPSKNKTQGQNLVLWCHVSVFISLRCCFTTTNFDAFSLGFYLKYQHKEAQLLDGRTMLQSYNFFFC